MLDREAIQALIPHRAPMLLVDEIVELEPGVRAVGLRHVAADDPVFAGHFPGQPILPGVLVIESLAQVALVALFALPEYHGRQPLFAGIDELRFRRPIVPGETIRLEATVGPLRRGFGSAEVVASVDGVVAVRGTLRVALLPSTTVERSPELGGVASV